MCLFWGSRTAKRRAASSRHTLPALVLGETTLESVDHFPYLGSCLSSNLDLSNKVQRRLRYTGTVFDHLYDRIIQGCDVRADAKMVAYKAVVIPVAVWKRWKIFIKDVFEVSWTLAGKTERHQRLESIQSKNRCSHHQDSIEMEWAHWFPHWWPELLGGKNPSLTI